MSVLDSSSPYMKNLNLVVFPTQVVYFVSYLSSAPRSLAVLFFPRKKKVLFSQEGLPTFIVQ